MPAEWTQDRVLGLAPDSASASAAQGLTNVRKWGMLGANPSTDAPRSLWGECQGSGKNPYQVRIDLSEPAFKCSCPSRKFPCKHGLALLLIFARDPAAFTPGEAPVWVADWLASREERQQKKAETAAKPKSDPPADPEAKAKRAAQRESNVLAGLDELDAWLHDLVAQGFAAARARPASSFQTIAARMVDAQAPGVARLLRDLEAAASGGGPGGSGVGGGGSGGVGGGWQLAMLELVGRIHMLASALRRIDHLPEEVQSDVRSGIGWTTAKEEVIGRDGLRDLWLIIGRTTEQEEPPSRVRVQRTWLWGAKCNQPALILDFAVGPVGLDGSLALGTAIDAEVAYFPSAAPERALVKQRLDADTARVQALPDVLPGADSIDEALGLYADVLAKCPWRERTLLSLRNIIPAVQDATLILIDSAGKCLPVARRFGMMPHGWRLLAISGGHPVHMFAEWDGRTLLPLGIVSAGVFHDVGPRAEV